MQRLVRSLERSPARVVAQHLDQLLDVRREEALQRALRLGVHLVLFVLLLGGRIDLLEAVRGALADGYALSRRVAAWVGVRVRVTARARVRLAPGAVAGAVAGAPPATSSAAALLSSRGRGRGRDRL